MKKSRGVLILALTVIVTALLIFTSAVGWGPTGTGAAKNIHTGLDLAGGVSITYEASEKNPSAEDMSDTIYKLQERVEQYSTESQVYQEGNNRIVVEIPGVTDANKILEELGKPGSLYFIAQKDADGNENYTLNTQTGEYELTKSVEELQEDGSIVLTGTDVSDAKAMVGQDKLGNNNQNVVSLTLNKSGTEKFAEATKRLWQMENLSAFIMTDILSAYLM